MKSHVIGIGAVVLCLLVLGWYWSHGGQHPPLPARPTATHSVQISPSAPKPQHRPVDAPIRPAPRDYRKEFQAAQDYWAYAQQLLPRAKAGDADAQFYLAKILEFCDSANKAFFEHLRQPITLDEALQKATKQNRSVELTQTIYTRCHGFQTQDGSSLGSALEWLNRATDAGQPAASATIATDILTRQYLESFQRAGGTPELGPEVRPGADPDALLLAAAQSLDPEALYTIGLAQGTRQRMAHSQDATEQYAWMLVGCQRGYPCNGHFDWITTGCPTCNPNNPTPEDSLMAEVGNNWAAVQQRAQQINASLEAGQWDALGLNSTQAASN